MRRRNLALLVLLLTLSACGTLNLPGLEPNPVSLPTSSEPVAYVNPGSTYTLTLSLTETKKSVEVRVALADPCAKGTTSCPGWDASRYPGVTHPTEPVRLDGTRSQATLTFAVAPDALPQGPFKYEVVVRDEGGKEWTLPFYLKIRDTEGRSALKALNDWRTRAGLPPVQEDPEWSWRGWLHSRYMVQSYPDRRPHDEDLSQPFSTPEGKEAGKRGNEWLRFYRLNGQPVFPPEEQTVNRWIAAPFHRFNLIYPWPLTVGSGTYWDVGPLPGYGGSYGRSGSTLPNLSLWTSDKPTREVLFPSPGMVVPLDRYIGSENPNPIYPCSNPSASPERPFLTQEGLTWDDGNGVVVTPIGFPITVMTFAKMDTKVLEARLTRTSDGALNPVCAYGSRQYWENRESRREQAVNDLKAHGALVVIPHKPLTPGAEYEVYVRGQIGSATWEKTWRFRVDTNLVPL
ncbi:CAP domain-containing protein [Thermus hydrothermalis]|uniref:CAP domain-containing protein n=1 Tax=Thermus hydrothermalis TaxID=2908148 RepID=UPI001FAA0583|nr:CAP domain-containing protein [Thermus hydrothermalis]